MRISSWYCARRARSSIASRVTTIATLLGVLSPFGSTWAQSCEGDVQAIGSGSVRQNALVIPNGGIALFAKMNINLDGYGRAYHRDNFQGGGVIHLCNAAEVFLPDGTSYQGSESNPTCTGKFMKDYQRIREAKWTDVTVGVIRWFGVLGTGSATIGGKTVNGVVPVEQADGSGFYVSPTTLVDSRMTDIKDQRRYIDALSVPSAVVRGSPALVKLGVVQGTLGVAIHRSKGIAVPFIVGDAGPRIGEGSAALARLVSGHPLVDSLTLKTRGLGQVDEPVVLWVFFGGPKLAPPYEGARVRAEAQNAFVKWGGESRLKSCLGSSKVPVN